MAKEKTTPEAELQHRVAMVSGKGEQLLRHIWRTVVSDASRLARLGWQATEDVIAQDFGPERCPYTGVHHPGVSKENVPERVMGFLSECMESFYWTHAWQQRSYPLAFAQLSMSLKFASVALPRRSLCGRPPLQLKLAAAKGRAYGTYGVKSFFLIGAPLSSDSECSTIITGTPLPTFCIGFNARTRGSETVACLPFG